MKIGAPMLMPLAGLICGTVMIMLGVPIWSLIILAALATGVYLIVTKLSKDPVKAFKYNGLHFVWLFLVFCIAGSLDAYLLRQKPIDGIEKYIAAKGKISRIEQTTAGDKAILELRELYDSDGKVTKVENIFAIVRSDILEYGIDDIIVLPVKLRKIEDSPNYFSSGYAKSMQRKGIYYETRVEGEAAERIGHETSMRGITDGMREKLESAIENTLLTKQTQNFLITVLLGDRSYLNREMRENFADAGLSHILALSGMHVAIICGIILWLLFPLNFLGRYKLRMCLALAILIFYAFITGWSASTVRATIMMGAVTTGILLERKNSSWNSLLLAVFVILLFDPYALTDIGLQLSFLCVTSLIFFVSPLNPFEQHEHPRLHKFATLLITTMVATLATWCVTAYYFGKTPLVFLPVNMLILPLLPAYLTIAIIYLVFVSTGIEPEPARFLLDKGYTGMTQLVEYLTSGGNTAVNFTPSLLSVVLWLVLLTFVILIIHGKHRKIYLSAGCALALLFVVSTVFSGDAENNDGYIVQTGWRNISILTRRGGCERSHTTEPRSLSCLEECGRKILVADISLEKCGELNGEFDEVIIGGGNRDDMRLLIEKTRAKVVILHSSVTRERESELIKAADSLGVKYHSIRNSGPYRFIEK